MTSFPLFHLPLVAMEHVLYMMNPLELFNISLTSTKCKRSVKTLSRIKRKFLMSLGIAAEEQYVMLSRLQPAASWAFTWVSDESKTGYEEDDRGGHDFYTVDKYSKNLVEELMKCYEHIKEVFGCQIDDIHFELNSFPSQNEQIIDWILSHQETIARVTVKDTKEGFEDDLEYLLDNLTITMTLDLSTKKYKRGFQLEIPRTPWHLIIKNSSFIDFDQLLTLENERISLSKSILTDQDINEFLKSWMACESHLYLETFEINISGPEAMEVIMDLPHNATADPKVIRTFKKKFDGSQIQEGFDIENLDGEVATVCYGLSSDGPRFFMFTR
uniref:F-box domain-containing protein n=1 Tax=Caenorhabditis tropicalis TaxID=1561998 RepID=A0A1I7TH79_9PELO